MGQPQGTDSRSTLIRRLAIASIARQLAWVAIVIVAGIVEPGYSEVRDAVSVLGARNAAHPWVFNSGVAIWGISFVLAAGAAPTCSPSAPPCSA